MAFGTGTQLQLNSPPEPSPEVLGQPGPALALLPAIEPWRAVFFRNLKDFLLFRDLPRPLDNRSYEGWRTAYVFTNPPWTRIRESWWGHALIAAATFAICSSPFFFRPLKTVSPFEHAHLEYYPVSDYLPPINNKAPRPRTAKKADPVFAKQEIISVRPEADNHTQTVITPPKVKLQHDVSLPNMAVWTADPVAPTVVAPAVQPKMVFPLAAQVVEPTPDMSKLRDKRSVTLQSSAVEPIANDQSLRRAGPLNIGNLKPDVVPPAPALPMQAQRASGVALAEAVPPAPALPSGAKRNAASAALQPQVVPPQAAAPAMAQRGTATNALQPQVVPPQPTVGSVPGSSGKATGQIIALSVRPADIHGPISAPVGNRNGEFAAGPNGKAGATGQPDSSPDARSSGNGAGGHENSGPAGVYVGAPPPGAATAPVVGTKPQPAPNTSAPKEMAKLQFPKMHASVAELAKETRPSDISPEDRSAMADNVFGSKRYYALTLNMPNLNSASGSWVVRFAELNDKHDGIPVLAPAATSKLDPIYPIELVHERVQGTVTLYAVIHRDGTVGEIRVLRSVDKLLDYSAMRALAGWRFQPGMKNGAAVDLEAIVDIPFHLKSDTF
jgi:TonB family protein